MIAFVPAMSYLIRIATKTFTFSVVCFVGGHKLVTLYIRFDRISNF